jgi:hypothetical protein
MPDGIFWYTVSTALFIFSIWLVKRFLDTNKEEKDREGILVKEMGKCLIELTTMTKIHDVHINSLLKNVEKHGDDIETLREFYIVTYKK